MLHRLDIDFLRMKSDQQLPGQKIADLWHQLHNLYASRHQDDEVIDEPDITAYPFHLGNPMVEYRAEEVGIELGGQIAYGTPFARRLSEKRFAWWYGVPQFFRTFTDAIILRRMGDDNAVDIQQTLQVIARVEVTQEEICHLK